MDKGICELCGHSGAVYLIQYYYKEYSVCVCQRCGRKIRSNNSLVLKAVFLAFGITAGILVAFVILFII